MYCSHSMYSKNCLGLLNLFLTKVLAADKQINVFNVEVFYFFGISLSNHTLADDRAVQCLPSLWRQLQCWDSQTARWWGGVMRVGGGELQRELKASVWVLIFVVIEETLVLSDDTCLSNRIISELFNATRETLHNNT